MTPRHSQRRREFWTSCMTMGSAVTTEPHPHVAVQDAVIVRLLQGPALQSELAPLSRNWGAMLHEVNKSLRLAGRHVVSEPVTVQSAHGLALKARRYRMVAW